MERFFSARVVEGGTGRVPTVVKQCNIQDVWLWQRTIQEPFVAPGGGIGRNWHWPALYTACRTFESLARRRLLAYQILVAGPSDAVPIAQCFISEPYIWPGGQDARLGCAFLWYAMATPVEALRHLGVHKRFATLELILALTVQESLAAGLKGRIGLHAALGSTEEESEALKQRYRRAGLRLREGPRSAFVRFPTRRDDGRFFYFTTADAEALLAKLQDLQ